MLIPTWQKRELKQFSITPSLLKSRRLFGLAYYSLYIARSYSSHCHSTEKKMVDWIFLSQMFARCVGIPLFLFGVIGNFLNIFIFIAVRAYRNNPCTLYLLAACVAGTMQLLGAIISRIIIMGFGYNLTRTSLIWCKYRQFIVATYVPMQLTYECWAIVDQFLATSRSARLRQLSNIKRTRGITVLTAIAWHLHSVPFLIFNDIR